MIAFALKMPRVINDKKLVHMNIQVEIEIVSKTDKGKVRAANEDAVATDAELGLVILADGMGGYIAGEVASRLATTEISSELSTHLPTWHLQSDDKWLHDVLAKTISHTNRAIFQAAESQPEFMGMGTTLVMALFKGNQVTVAHLGDSRFYRLRGGEFKQMTWDHSLLQEQIDAGMITQEQAKKSPHKNLVTRALGVDFIVRPDIADFETEAGDLYMLCSDGLSDMVEDAAIAQVLKAQRGNIDAAATGLIGLANEKGGRDNISVIIVKVLAHRNKNGNVFSRLMNWLK